MLESFNTGKFTYKRLSLEEQKSRGILGRLTGIIADTTGATRNGRKYSSELWENVFKNPIIKEKIANRCMFGELGHPTDREEVDMEKIAICLAEQPKKGSDGKLYGVFDILSTPNGKLLKTLCDYGCNIGVSSRGSGDLYTDENGDESVDPDTYNCECWDAVLVPAVESARLSYVTESLDTVKRNKTLRQKLTEELEKAPEDEKNIMEESLANLDIDLNESRVLTKGDELHKPEVHEVVDTLVSENGDTYMQLDTGDWVTQKDVEAVEGNGAPKPEEPKEPIEEPAPVEDEPIDEPVEPIEEPEDFEPEPEETLTESDVVTGKNVDDLDDKLHAFGFEMEAADKAQPQEKVTLYDKNGKKFGATFNKYSDGGVEVLNIAPLDEDFDTTKVIKTLNDEITTDEDIEQIKEYLTDIINYCYSVADEYDIQIGDISESCSHKEVKEEADNVGDLNELQEMLMKISKLEKDNLSLQEKLSVCSAKETKLGEELVNRKKELKSKTKAINEELESTKKILNSRTESLSEALDYIDTLENDIKTLNESISLKESSITDLQSKSTNAHAIVKKYKKALSMARNKYIEAKASACGVSPEEIKSQLNESFSFEAVDSICDSLLSQKKNLRKLPFMLNENVKLNIKGSKNESIKKSVGLGNSDDDDISGLMSLLN